MQHSSYAPLIEFHGYSHSGFMSLRDNLLDALKKVFSEDDYKNVTFSEIKTKVIDTEKTDRPFLRMFSSEFAIVHQVIEVLEELGCEAEVEFIKITNYFDLRKKKKM